MKKIKTFLLFAILLIIISKTSAQTVYGTITTIYTPRGTAVWADYIYGGEMTESEKLYWKDYHLWYYQNRITYISEATRTYNCHGYAWHVTEGGNHYSLDREEFPKFWLDSSYVATTATLGTKVSYVNGDHSAITTNQPGIFESKWGPNPVFRHTVDDCPYNNYTEIHYYRYNPHCTSATVNFTNQTVNANQTVTGCKINAQNVTVTNNKKLTLEAQEEIFINGTLDLPVGSEFEMKIGNGPPIIPPIPPIIIQKPTIGF